MGHLKQQTLWLMVCYVKHNYIFTLFVLGYGNIGKRKNPAEADYTGFTIGFPTIKFPGSYAFTVVMWNGISK